VSPSASEIQGTKAGLIYRLIWKDLYVVYDKMKDETDELREALKSYCKLLNSQDKDIAEWQVSVGHLPLKLAESPHSSFQPPTRPTRNATTPYATVSESSFPTIYAR
jgi:hypothetical protein